MSLLKLSIIPLPLDHPQSKSTATHQLSQPSQRSPNASSTSFCEHKRYVKGEHVKPVFQPPLPKNAELETEPDDGVNYSYDFKTSLETQKSGKENFLKPKAGIIPIFPIKFHSSPNIPYQTRLESLRPEELCIEDTKQYLGNNISVAATGAKDNESECLMSFDSGTIYPVDLHQIEKVLDRIGRGRSIGTLTSQNPAISPSKFALDVKKQSSIDTNMTIRGQNRTRLMTEDGPSSPIAARSHAVTSESQGRKIWGKLSNVLQSVTIIQRPEAVNIHDMREVTHEIKTFQLRGQIANLENKDKILYQKKEYKLEPTKDAFSLIRRVAVFCECAKVGSKKHIDIMRKIMETDPKKHMIEKSDPDHLLNKCDTDGLTPLYNAAQNGNLDVIKFLIENGAEYFIESKLNNGKEPGRTPLEAAVMWSHIQVVEYFLEKCNYPKEIVKRCLKLASNKIIKSMLKKYS